MSLSTFAYIIGIIEFLVGIPLLLSSKKTVQWLLAFIRSDISVRIVGAIMVIVAFFVLRDDWSIGKDTAGLMRLIAWITVIKGLCYCWWPEHLEKKTKKWLKTTAQTSLFGLVAILLGTLFLMAGQILA